MYWADSDAIYESALVLFQCWFYCAQESLPASDKKKAGRKKGVFCLEYCCPSAKGSFVLVGLYFAW